ncbi:hypothetical protein J2X69_003012 [Algoriphagus sp. 4150]|uniref:DUF4412 domain-containing protein n=1 Tax=Algoriphagus sp. 4150 TaxID=2817756 RepID=UPI00285CE9E8|nr:DUF4412 domain-containing protein [Algoriphagus sp. 4150]MDR7130655.1 hypothetical protein [Algoriphagus sp. 4150]
MNNLLRSSILLVVVSSLSLSVEAQIMRKIQNAANRGVEKALERKVEDEASKMTERQVEKIFSDMYGDSEDRASGSIDFSKIMKGLGEPVDTEDQYDFFGHIVLEMTSRDNKGKTSDPVLFKSYLAKSSNYTGMELVDPKKPEAMTSMVFDMKNQASIVFLENKGEKSSFAYKMDLDAIDDAVSDHLDTLSVGDVVVKKTGKTKDILGYPCEEYHVKNEDGEGYYWVTNKAIGGYSSLWSSNNPMMSSKAQEKYAQHYKNFPKGNFMELTYSTEDAGTMEMRVIQIDESAPKSLAMAQYPNIMNSMKEK